MDITRFSLYGALAIVTYLMLLAWQEDYPPVIDSITNTEATSAVANDLPETPSVQAPDTQINSTPTQLLCQHPV
jgi:YidC/Oxa1 family membrane protein insertase